MAYRNYLVISVILLLVAGYWLYDDSMGGINPVGRVTEHFEQGVDYFVADALITEYDVSGALDYQLVAETISHFQHDDTVLLQQPLLTTFGDDGQVTTTRSEHGKVLPNGKDIELWDNVVIIQSRPSGKNPQDGLVQQVRMDTDFITVFPDKAFADTDRPVVMVNNTGETRANGMSAWYQQGKVRLKSMVRGVHEFGQRAD